MVKCAIIGCGLMGCKIAGDLKLHGHHVKVFDNNFENLAKLHRRIQEDVRTLQTESQYPQPDFPGIVLAMSRLSEAVKNVEFVFECVVEDLAIKQDLFREISIFAPANAIIATNSLSLSIDEVISKQVTNKQRCLGIRFLFPVYNIPEVEVSLAHETSNDTITRVQEFMQKMGKTLFFRSGTKPLILTDEEIQQRLQKATHTFDAIMPNLSNSRLIVDFSFDKELSDGTKLAPNSTISSSVNSTTAAALIRALAMKQSNPASQEDASLIECVICQEGPRECLLYPCKHFVLCRTCAIGLLDRNDYCPICREKIEQVSNIYMS